MTTANKNYLIVGLSLLVLVFAFFWFKACTKTRPEVIATTGDSVQIYKNKLDQKVYALKKLEEDYLFLDSHYKDSIAKLFKARARDISSFTQVITKLKGQAKGSDPQIVYEPYPIYRDTGGNCPPQIHSMSDIFLDPYYTIQATLFPNYPDSNLVELLAYDTVSIITRKTKEGGLFNKRSFLEIDVINANPHASIEGIKHFKIPESKPKKFGIGLQVGYGFSKGVQPQLYGGIGLQYSIIRF